MKMRAAIYSRFSTDKQSESSIEDQVRVCSEYAANQGWTISHRFEDQGISGAAIGNRPGCVAMLDAAKAREFDVLLIMDTSRLSRSSADLSKIADRLVFMGLRIVAVQEPGADTSRDGWELYFGLSGLMGQQFRKMTAKKTHTALESRARKGAGTGGRAYGYTSQNEVVPEEAAIVREMFERYADGESQQSIAESLRRRGVLSPRGRPWVLSAVHAILHNERYTGRVVWNRTVWRKDPDSGVRTRAERPQSEWVISDREDLRIVPANLWERVRSRDTPAVYGSQQARPKYALSGLLVCGECGGALTLSGGRNSRGFGSQRYVCDGYRQKLGCKNGISVSRALAEDLLITPLRDRLLGDEKFLSAVSELKKSAAKIQERKNSPPSASFTTGMRAEAFRGVGVAGGTEDAYLAKVGAINAAVAAGALSSVDGQAHIARLRAELARDTVTPETDEAAALAALERLKAALAGAAVDVLREALRRALGTVRCVPREDANGRYLAAVPGGGEAVQLLDWLYIGGPDTGLSALVAGAGFEPATFGL